MTENKTKVEVGQLPEDMKMTSSTQEKEGICLVVCLSHKDIHLVLSVLGDEFFPGIVGKSFR